MKAHFLNFRCPSSVPNLRASAVYSALICVKTLGQAEITLHDLTFGFGCVVWAACMCPLTSGLRHKVPPPFFSLRQEACVGGQPTTRWAFKVYVWAFPLTFSSTYTLAHSKPTSTVISETYTVLNSIKPGCGPSDKFLSMNQSKTVLLLVCTQLIGIVHMLCCNKYSKAVLE